MSYYVYILYSEVQDKYYIGSTQDVTERLDRHNSGKEKYTSKYIPWNLVLSLKKETRSEAYQLEIKIELYQCDLYFSSIYLGVMPNEKQIYLSTLDTNLFFTSVLVLYSFNSLFFKFC